MTDPTWISNYITALPEPLRPDPNDPLLIDAAHKATANTWAARQLAGAVAAPKYLTARNPVLMALRRMASLAAAPPPDNKPPHKAQSPCGRHDCRCTHTECDHGWLNQTQGPTRPCPQCRPQLAERLANIPPPGRRDEAHLAYLRHRDP